MARSLRDYLQDIHTAATKAITFVGDRDLATFLQDEKTTFAVARALTIIGEATKQIPFELRQHYSHIPWRAVAGMRDKLTHEYFRVDNRRLYYTVRQELLVLLQTVQRMLVD